MNFGAEASNIYSTSANTGGHFFNLEYLKWRSHVTNGSEWVTRGITNIHIEWGSGMDGCLCIMYFHLLGEVDNQRLLLHQLSFIKKTNQEDILRMCLILRWTKHLRKYSGPPSNMPEITGAFVVLLEKRPLEWDLCYAKKLYSSCRVPGIWDNGQCF